MKTLAILAASAALFAAPLVAEAAPKHCPPGHAKKGWCSPGPKHNSHDRQRVQRDVVREYVIIRDHDRYGLRAPRDGYYYGVLNEEVFLISKATQEVIEGIGAVGYLLNRVD